MPGLPNDLYNHCRDILLRCSESDSDDRLRAVFVIPELRPFQSGLPEAASKSERVDACLAFLADKCLSDGRPILPIFFEALRNKYEEGNALYDELGLLVEATQSLTEKIVISEDGLVIPDDETLYPPLPEFDLHILEELEVPTGAVKLRDKFYIERDADAHLKREVVRLGTTTTIRAPHQTGKTSLLMRGVHQARANCAKTVTLSLQGFSSDRLTSLDVFLRDLAELMIRRLRLAEIELEKLWDSSLGPPFKLTYLIEDYILSEVDVPIVLAIDEADLLLRTSFYKEFFAMVRWWHDRRADNEEWDRLNIVMVISTEPYLLMPNSPQSPFNVGTKLSLKDFIQNQVRDLNQRHGSPVSDNDFPQLMRLLNGHPYLTRLALYTLVVEKMSWDNLVRTSMAHEGPFGNHLWHHYLQLRKDRRLRKALKEVIRYDCCSDEMSLVRLLKAGLVKGQGNVYTCRCDLYRMYFEEKLQ